MNQELLLLARKEVEPQPSTSTGALTEPIVSKINKTKNSTASNLLTMGPRMTRSQELRQKMTLAKNQEDLEKSLGVTKSQHQHAKKQSKNQKKS